MSQKSLQTIAAEWHFGQFSALYAYASTQTILQSDLSNEIADCLSNARPLERRDLLRLYVNTAPALEIQDLLDYREFWHRFERNADGTPVRCRKNGQLKLWKTRPYDFKQPVKYGLKQSFYITPENIGDWCAPLGIL